MPVVIKDGNFVEDQFAIDGGGFTTLSKLAAEAFDSTGELVGVDVSSDTHPSDLLGFISHVSAIRIQFPNFADGRGFSIARRLRQMGFKGLLRAHGPILADQYPMALRVGFDEVEIPAEHAGRQPQAQWQDAMQRVKDNYQERVMAPTQHAPAGE